MIILDASFLVKLILEEPYSHEAYDIIEGLLRRSEKLITVDIALPETLNALWKHHVILKDISEKTLMEAVSDLMELWSKLDKIHIEELVKEAVEIAIKYNITIYDSLYLAAADKYNAGLATYDERQRAVAGEMKVLTLSS